MKTLSDLLLLGDPRLYERCEPVSQDEISMLEEWKADLQNVMAEVRQKYGFGRAIAAPQLGIMKRLIYLHIDTPTLIINPEIVPSGPGRMEVWDDCMSFPNLLVRVKRYRHTTLRFLDEQWNEQEWQLEDDLSELMQHEVDHLNGILATMRAMDNRSFRWRSSHSSEDPAHTLNL